MTTTTTENKFAIPAIVSENDVTARVLLTVQQQWLLNNVGIDYRLEESGVYSYNNEPWTDRRSNILVANRAIFREIDNKTYEYILTPVGDSRSTKVQRTKLLNAIESSLASAQRSAERQREQAIAEAKRAASFANRKDVWDIRFRKDSCNNRGMVYVCAYLTNAPEGEYSSSYGENSTTISIYFNVDDNGEVTTHYTTDLWSIRDKEFFSMEEALEAVKSIYQLSLDGVNASYAQNAELAIAALAEAGITDFAN